MSLFASSFETGITAGPSTSLGQAGSGKKNNKRKRPSNTAGPANNDDQLRAAQKNLEKLMKAVEGGGLDDKPKRDGGHSSVKKPKQSATPQKQSMTPDKRSKQPQSSGKANPGKKERQKSDAGLSSTSKKGESMLQATSTQGENGTPMSKKEKKKAKHAVEIPVPPSPAVKDEDAAGLTSMQKGMKSKLEGARFRLALMLIVV